MESVEDRAVRDMGEIEELAYHALEALDCDDEREAKRAVQDIRDKSKQWSE